MRFIILSLLSLFSISNSFGQAGIYKTASDFKSGKLVDMGTLDEVKNGKLFFNKDGEITKVKKNDYYGFMDNEGYQLRFSSKTSSVHRLHVKGSICVWGKGIDTTVEDNGDFYIIDSGYSPPYASKNLTSELISISSPNISEIGKLIRADSKLYRIYKRIKKKTFIANYDLLQYIVYLYNQRRPLKNGFIK